jgi:predicted small lipoprotein YifL
MRLQIRALIFILLGLNLVVGCGQKGALYLPGDPSSVTTAVPSQTSPATEEEYSDDDVDNDDDVDDDEDEQ